MKNRFPAEYLAHAQLHHFGMEEGEDDAYRPTGRAHEPAVRAQRPKHTAVRGMMAAFLSKTSRISKDGSHILRKTGPRKGATYDVQTDSAPAGLRRCSAEVDQNQEIVGKRTRKQPGHIVRCDLN